MRWARLARIAGLRELCLSILNWMVVTWPDREEARDMRTELLLELGRGPVPVEAVQAAQTPPSLDFDDKLTDSFTAMRSRESAVRRYLDLFQGREDVFARQWADKEAGTQGYVPVRRAIQGEDILEHLQGRKTYGIYLLQEDSRVCLAVIDADMHPRLRTDKLSAADRDLARRERDYLLRRLPELGRELGMPCLTEFSGGKGYHFWYFFAEPVPAALPRQALNRLVKRISPDLTCFSLEVFPKQDTLAGKGLGNLVKLPLGIHRVSGKASRFLQVRDPSPWAQLKVLDNIGRIDVEILERHAGGLDPEQGATVLVHPRHQAWADDFPELARLADACPALGQIVASCRMSRTLSVRDEKVILGTLGFLPRAKTLIHHLHQSLPDYNQHLVDYKLSRVRGTPLGCKRIHSLLNMTQDQCLFENAASYAHPLLHLPDWIDQEPEVKSERVENLQAALDSLEGAIRQVRRFLRPAQA
ncbi:MAG: DNA primase [Desulfovibrionales bacterium]|nr:MAG: DNA primase [Desulfovibrionales bacterium]